MIKKLIIKSLEIQVDILTKHINAYENGTISSTEFKYRVKTVLSALEDIVRM